MLANCNKSLIIQSYHFEPNQSSENKSSRAQCIFDFQKAKGPPIGNVTLASNNNRADVPEILFSIPAESQSTRRTLI